jgi:hypothetical protein
VIRQILRPVQEAGRSLLIRAAMLSAAGFIGAVGCGFVLLAAYLGLRLLVGSELAALLVGVTLLAVAAGLAALGRGRVKAPEAPIPEPASPQDPVSMAVFTAAFVLGRYIAGRGRN